MRCSTSSYTCGPSAAAAVLAVYGITKTEGEMAVKSFTLPHGGTTVHQGCYAINQVFIEEGHQQRYHLQGIRNLQRPQDLSYPCLTAIKLPLINHMVCLKGVNSKGQIMMADPHSGPTTISWKHLQTICLGGVVASPIPQ